MAVFSYRRRTLVYVSFICTKNKGTLTLIKLFINQLGVAIFSFFLYTAVGMIDDPGLKRGLNIAVSIVSILFFCFLLYTVSWEWGAKDKIRIDGGRIQEFKYKGVLISLYANVINFVIAFVAFISVLIFMISQPTNWLFEPSLTITIDVVPTNFALQLHSVFNQVHNAIPSVLDVYWHRK